MKRYRKREQTEVTAVQINLNLREGVLHFEKWGGPQTAKQGDWLVDNNGECYTIDADSFAQTYAEVSAGRYVKIANVWAEVAQEAGDLPTKEGSTSYEQGWYLVYNNEDRTDRYTMEPAQFETTYVEQPKRALILVDIQNDFLRGGALAVPDGNAVIAVANSVQQQFDLVVATQDWHPANHGSFAANHEGHRPGDVIDLDGLEQILWPTHCVQGTGGAKFAPNLDQSRWAKVFRKGTSPNIDSYSGFFDNGQRIATGLGQYLRGEEVAEVYVMGLATDYCVKFTALDARKLGFKTFLLVDGCRGVDLQFGNVARSLAEMREAGVVAVHSHEFRGVSR